MVPWLHDGTMEKLLWLPLSLMIVACAGTELRPAPKPHVGEGYQLRVETPPTIKSGEPFTATLHVKPSPPYRLTLNFPVEVTFTSGMQPPEQSVGFDELEVYTADRLEAQTSFTSLTPGTTNLSVMARFSLCTESNCTIIDADEEVEIVVQ